MPPNWRGSETRWEIEAAGELEVVDGRKEGACLSVSGLRQYETQQCECPDDDWTAHVMRKARRYPVDRLAMLGEVRKRCETS